MTRDLLQPGTAGNSKVGSDVRTLPCFSRLIVEALGVLVMYHRSSVYSLSYLGCYRMISTPNYAVTRTCNSFPFFLDASSFSQFPQSQCVVSNHCLRPWIGQNMTSINVFMPLLLPFTVVCTVSLQLGQSIHWGSSLSSFSGTVGWAEL